MPWWGWLVVGAVIAWLAVVIYLAHLFRDMWRDF
jgi:hypothetical protein